MAKLCLCRNKDSETYHLYECKVNLEGKCNFTPNKNSNCNHAKRDDTECLSTCQNENDMRIEIAKLANQGQQICGICVATLYKNQI